MTQTTSRRALFVCLVVAAASGCSAPGGGIDAGGITPANHTFFPIGSGTAHELGLTLSDGTMSCESCHPPSAASFKDFSCISCHGHEQTVTDRLHISVIGYGYASSKCFSCHPDGTKIAFDHQGITGNCAQCHDVDTQFAALPKAGFTHPPTGGTDCSACHNTTDWTGAQGGPTAPVNDPLRDVQVDAQTANWSGTTIATFNALTQFMPMPMNHGSTQIAAAAFSACTNCHADATLGIFYPGTLHTSLSALTLPAPTACAGCHAKSRPEGFVGPDATNPVRFPTSGEMNHDAVAWVNDLPTATPLVTQDCAVCHTSPTDFSTASWQTGSQPVDGGGAMLFHANLTAASQPQPTSCVACHANSRPVVALTSGNSTVPATVTFDHQAANALSDCAACHVRAPAQYASWNQGRFHLPGAANPANCVSCHAARRPTSTVGWVGNFTQSPFDYGTNSRGVTHGAGLDCATCHAGPGTGLWGSTQNWAGGVFTHSVTSLAGNTCVSCHTTQRPDLLPGLNAVTAAAALGGFDHATNGAGDCFGCHQATVVANTYANLYNPGTGVLPNGDWKGGVTYPGAVFVASLTQSVTVAQTKLNRSGANNLITSTTTTPATYYNGMSHTSGALPMELNAGPTGTPDYAKCWHCHTNDAGTVTNYSNGLYHASLNNYRSAPDAGLAPFAQPLTGCNGCHAQMRPSDIVQRSANAFFPMDHNAPFTATTNIGGTNTNNANGLDCSRCHQTTAGTTWADGQYHPRIATAVPQKCETCHYLAMADAGISDVTVSPRYVMKHRSGQITFQTCDTCHTTALAQSQTAPNNAQRWLTGGYHPRVTTQPGACLDCHSLTDPVVSTQGTIAYAFASGGSLTNANQWMAHTSASVVGKDCAVCHATDAKASGAAWSKTTALHRGGVTTNSCRECHGLTNGGGSVPGTNNNLPAGLNNSKTLSPVAQVPNSGVSATTYDQITHGDVNVSARDCNFCHTQAGASTVVGVAGKEWAQASFHVKFNAANPLQMNGTTGRCSNCHLNVKPGTAYTAYNHAALTNASGSTDCVSCHSWPGTGTAAAPNWKGAVGGAPVNISVGGFNIAQPPAANATTVQAGISNLPHPAGTCTQCHAGGVGGKNAMGYDHALAPASQCAACHEAGSNLVGTKWDGVVAATLLQASCGQGGGSVRDRAGDTRALGITNLACSDKANNKTCGSASCSVNHFYPTDCKECHNKPAAGVRVTQTGATYVSGWRFPHTQGNMAAATCCMCHNANGNGTCRP